MAYHCILDVFGVGTDERHPAQPQVREGLDRRRQRVRHVPRLAAGPDEFPDPVSKLHA